MLAAHPGAPAGIGTSPHSTRRPGRGQGLLSRANRAYLRRRKVRDTIPEPCDQRAHRRRRGAAEGRPTGLDAERYKARNVVERAIDRLKNFRAVVTCYDERAYIFIGTVTLAALAI